MPWKCKVCSKRYTFRRPPLTECKKCRPECKTGLHNKLQPKCRLKKKKTAPSELRHRANRSSWSDVDSQGQDCSSKIAISAWEKPKKDTSSSQGSGLQDVREGLEAEQAVLLKVTGWNYPATHSILATAHGLLGRLTCAKLVFQPHAGGVWLDFFCYGRCGRSAGSRPSSDTVPESS